MAAGGRPLLSDPDPGRIPSAHLDHVSKFDGHREVLLVTDEPRIVRPKSMQVRCCDLVYVGTVLHP